MAKQLIRTAKHSWRGIHLALVMGVLAVAVLAASGCSAAPQPTAPAAEPAPIQEAPAAAPATPTEAPAAAAAVTKLEIDDVKAGKGDKVKAGDTVSVHYTGWLMDGTKFDSSLDRGEPFEFVVGQGLVIPGWDQGLVGMKAGGKRVLIIPSDMGYGPAGTPDGTIPPDSPLKFEIELIRITPA